MQIIARFRPSTLHVGVLRRDLFVCGTGMLSLLAALGSGAAAAPTLGASSGLTMTTFGNSALHGAPLTNKTVPNLELSVPLSATVGSAEVTGSLTFDKDVSEASMTLFPQLIISRSSRCDR